MKRAKPPSIITVAIVTTITIIFWIFFEVYQILTGEADINIPEELLKPINPTLNQETLSSLKGRINFQKENVTHFSSSTGIGGNINITEEIEIPTLTPTPNPAEGESEEVVATESGELLQ